jgi:hypothetical protein
VVTKWVPMHTWQVLLSSCTFGITATSLMCCGLKEASKK